MTPAARPNPLIAVPTYLLPGGQIGRWGSGGYALPIPYVDALARAGGVAVLVPARLDVDPVGALAPFDGLLLAGGGDIDPARYGEAPHEQVYGVDAARDGFEMAALAEARRRGLPVLAICRGMQVVNVAHGGTLLQHVADQPGLGAHGQPGGGKSAVHDVRVDPASRLAAATAAATTAAGATTAGAARIERCTSWHHQAVATVGSGLRAVGWTDDGLVEALEPAGAGGGWLLAVQWHPETTAAVDRVQQALFDAFVAQCAGQRDGDEAAAVPYSSATPRG